MDNLQYLKKSLSKAQAISGFKPYYKWITLNTQFVTYAAAAEGKF